MSPEPIEPRATEPMTKAERAAAEALAEIASQTYGGQSFNVEGFADDARAVVAAVRPLIEADTLDRFADHLRALVATESWCEETADSGMKLAASEAEDEAAALRTTTPEES